MKQADKRKKGVPAPAPTAPPGMAAPSAFALILFCTLVLIILCTGIVMRLDRFLEVTSRSPDEGIYTSQGALLVEKGHTGYRELARIYDSDPRLWVYPPPHRVGYLWLLSTTMKAFGSSEAHIGAVISTLASIATLLLVFLFGLRFFDRWTAVIAMLFLAVSPMDLACACRTWQDSLLGFLAFTLFWATCEIVRNGRAYAWWIAFLITGSYLLTVKETGLIVYAACTVIVLIALALERSWKRMSLFMLMSGLGGIISLAVMGYAVGGVSVLIRIASHMREGLPTNTYAATYQNDPPLRFLRGFWLVSPMGSMLCLAGIASGVYSVLKPKKQVPQSPDRSQGILAATAFFTIAVIGFGCVPLVQNLRYTSGMFGTFYLLAGYGARSIAAWCRRLCSGLMFGMLVAGIAILCIGSAMRDYSMFRATFVRSGIVDTTVRLMEEAGRAPRQSP